MRRPGTFDLFEGETLRDAALDGFDARSAALGDGWRARAERYVLGLEVGARFTTDEVARAVGYPEGDPRAFGALMRWAAQRHLVRKSPEPPIKSERTSCHARPITVWVRSEGRTS